MLDDSFTPHGKHLIAGHWVAGEAQFISAPATGPAHSFGVGTPALVDRAGRAAQEAVWFYAQTSREGRAAFLNAISDEIEARADQITQIGTEETGLPEARLVGERGRTVEQLRLFANHILKGAHLDLRHDEALPDRQPLPRPDMKMVQRPIGPVAVFGASNFPLAFSTAGGDTAAALAAGCPVVVKGHSAHPGTGEIVAEAVHAARVRCNLHPGTFSLIQGGRRDVGQALVQHPAIQAVGFTGIPPSASRRIARICASVYLVVFIHNLIAHLGEKILLMQPLTFGGIAKGRREIGQLDPPARQVSIHAPVKGRQEETEWHSVAVTFRSTPL